jgi:hypothetical protein
MRAFVVLLQHYPGAAAGMLGAGVAQAGRAAVAEVRDLLRLTADCKAETIE